MLTGRLTSCEAMSAHSILRYRHRICLKCVYALFSIVLAISFLVFLPVTSEAQTVQRAHHGLQIENITPELRAAHGVAAESGALITGIIAGSRAEKAGLRRYDVITEIDHTLIEDVATFESKMAELSPGTEVRLRVMRNSREYRVTLTLESPQMPPPVIAGDRASLTHWPSVGTLRYVNAQTRTSGHICGGSVVAPNWFLTAAHCVVVHANDGTLVGAYPDNGGQPLDGTLEVVLGVDDLETISSESTYLIDKIVVHPDFLNSYRRERKRGLSKDEAIDRVTITTGADIALVRLKRAWAGPVATLWLEPSDAQLLVAGQPLEVAGFGYVEPLAERRQMRQYKRTNGEIYFSGSSSLLQGTVRKVQTPVCAARYATKYQDVSIGQRQICADTNWQDSCQGDSGGPLSFNNYGTMLQVGLVSWGRGCAERDWFGIYTRISPFSNWLRTIVGNQLIHAPLGHYVLGDPEATDHSLALYRQPSPVRGARLEFLPVNARLFVLEVRDDRWWRVRTTSNVEAWALSERFGRPLISCCRK